MVENIEVLHAHQSKFESSSPDQVVPLDTTHQVEALQSSRGWPPDKGDVDSDKSHRRHDSD